MDMIKYAAPLILSLPLGSDLFRPGRIFLRHCFHVPLWLSFLFLDFFFFTLRLWLFLCLRVGRTRGIVSLATPIEFDSVKAYISFYLFLFSRVYFFGRRTLSTSGRHSAYHQAVEITSFRFGTRRQQLGFCLTENSGAEFIITR